MNAHLLAEERSIALHQAVAERLLSDPALVARAKLRVFEWRRSGALSPACADAWTRALELPLDELCAKLTDQSESARALRQCTPFAGALDAKTRWRIWRAVRDHPRWAADP